MHLSLLFCFLFWVSTRSLFLVSRLIMETLPMQAFDLTSCFFRNILLLNVIVPCFSYFNLLGQLFVAQTINCIKEIGTDHQSLTFDGYCMPDTLCF